MTCPSCHGTGRWLFEDSETLMDCPTCAGSGRQMENEMTDDPTLMTYEDAKSSCHVRSAIARASKPEKKYPKNHHLSFDDRVPAEDQMANDWQEHDPREGIWKRTE